VRSAPAVRAFLVASCAVLASSCEDLPNIPPVASFIFSPVSPIVSGQSVVVFNASGSDDADGAVRSYTWEFGDGSGAVRADGASTTHVFPDTPATCVEIVYTVLLTVEDDGGARASASQQVRVVELPAPSSLACSGR
jgi:PKD repeat protein